MINSLVSASLKHNDSSYLEKFPRILLTQDEIDLFEWIIEYKSKFHTLPTAERLEETEHGDYITEHMIKSPLADIYQQALVLKRKQYALKEFRNIQLEIDDNPEAIETSKIIDLGFRLSALSENETIYLSDYDRDSIYSDDEPEGVKFGFPSIDNATGGLLNGEFGIITGRPESGKTLLTNFIAWNIITDYGFYEHCKTVLYISAEMTPQKIIMRMDSIAGQFNSKIIRQKKNKEHLKEAKEKAQKAWAKVKTNGGNLIIPKLGIITPENVLDEINKHQPDFVICDAMYRFVNHGKSSQDWRNDVEIVRSVANICRMTNTPILGTTQIVRTAQKGAYDLNDLSYSDAYAQEPDLVYGIYRLPSKPNSIIAHPMKLRDANKVGDTEIKVSFNNSTYTEFDFDDIEGNDE